MLTKEGFTSSLIHPDLKDSISYERAMEWQWLDLAGRDSRAYPPTEGNDFIFEVTSQPAATHHLPPPRQPWSSYQPATLST